MTILQSEALTALNAKLPLHEARLKIECDDFRRVTKLQRPDAFYDATSVSAMMPVDKRTIAAPPENLKNRNIGTSAADDAKRQQEDMERTLNGETLAPRTDTNATLDEINRRAQAEDRAIEFLKKQIAAERYKLSVEHCKSLKPKEAQLMARLYKALAEVHTVYSEIDDIRQGLIEDGIGLRGIFLDMPLFIDNPRSKTSELAEYFKRGKEAGFINAIPTAFQ